MRRLIWIAFLVFVPACRHGDGLARVEVRGTVTYQGAPVEQGVITFRPANGSRGPAAGTGITGGQFFLPAEMGPIAGPHEVEVRVAEVVNNPGKSDESSMMNHGAAPLKSFSQQVEIIAGTNKLEFSFPMNAPKPTDHP
jgi:hypothetical protein